LPFEYAAIVRKSRCSQESTKWSRGGTTLKLSIKQLNRRKEAISQGIADFYQIRINQVVKRRNSSRKFNEGYLELIQLAVRWEDYSKQKINWKSHCQWWVRGE